MGRDYSNKLWDSGQSQKDIFTNKWILMGKWTMLIMKLGCDFTKRDGIFFDLWKYLFTGPLHGTFTMLETQNKENENIKFKKIEHYPQ